MPQPEISTLIDLQRPVKTEQKKPRAAPRPDRSACAAAATTPR